MYQKKYRRLKTRLKIPPKIPKTRTKGETQEITVTKEERGQMTLKNGCVWVNKSEIANLNNKWPEIDMCILEKN